MQVTHAGYKDPNNLKFEDITVLGVPYPPESVSVKHIIPGTTGNSTTTLPNTNIQYDADKKVNTHNLKIKNNYFFEPCSEIQKTLTMVCLTCKVNLGFRVVPKDTMT